MSISSRKSNDGVIFDFTFNAKAPQGLGVLLGKRAEDFKEALIGQAEDLTDSVLLKIAVTKAGQIEQELAKGLKTSLLNLSRQINQQMFEVHHNAPVKGLPVNIRERFDFPRQWSFTLGGQTSTTMWKQVKYGYARKKYRRFGSRKFFVYSGDLQRSLGSALSGALIKLAPPIKIEIKRGTTSLGKRGTFDTYEVIATASSSPLFGSGVRGQSSLRKAQEVILSKMDGLDQKSKIKLQQKSIQNFRPTIVIVVRHWITFVFPRLLKDAVRRANDKAVRINTTSESAARAYGLGQGGLGGNNGRKSGAQ